jgi:hypothetical protein
MQASDGSMAALDVPELESLNGVVVVAEVVAALEPDTYGDEDATGPFGLSAEDRVLDRLDEHAYLELDSGLAENASAEDANSGGR